MPTLRRGAVTITVPAETVPDYVAQGWVDPSVAPLEVKPTRRRSLTAARKPQARKPREPKPKETNDGVSVRSDGEEGAAQADPEPVRP